jgi:hypothetical protein
MMSYRRFRHFVPSAFLGVVKSFSHWSRQHPKVLMKKMIAA